MTNVLLNVVITGAFAGVRIWKAIQVPSVTLMHQESLR